MAYDILDCHTHSLCSALCPGWIPKLSRTLVHQVPGLANADSVGGGSDTHHSSSTRDHDTHVRSLHDANRFLLCITHKLCFVCFNLFGLILLYLIMLVALLPVFTVFNK